MQMFKCGCKKEDKWTYRECWLEGFDKDDYEWRDMDGSDDECG